MWTRVARIILRNRILILIILGVITAFMAYQATKVKLSYDYVKVLPEKDTSYVDHMYFKSIFGEEANVFALGVRDSNFFTIEKYKRWQQLREEILKNDSITKVLSIYDILNFHKNSEARQFDIDTVFPSNIRTQEELDSLVEIARSLPFYNNALYNDTAHVYLMLISIAKGTLNDKSRMDLISDITRVADKFGENCNLKVHYSGHPFIRTEITKKVKSEMNLFIILAFIVCVITLYLFFRSIKAVFFSMLVVTVGVIWSFGTLALFKFNISMLTGMVPPLLIVIGIPNCIFLLNKYHSEYKLHGNKVKALQRAIHKIGNAIIFSNLTTACGFGTFIITSSDVLKEFGIIASINIIGLFFISLMLIPIIFSFLNPPRERHTKHLDNKIFTTIINILVNVTLGYRRWIYIASILFVIAGGIGIYLIKSTGFMVDDIPHHDRVYVDLKFFEQHFKGVMPFEVMIDTKKKKSAYKNKVLKDIDKLQNYISSLPEFSKSLSLVDGFKFARQAYFNGKESNFKLPSKQEQNFILPYLSRKKGDSTMTEAENILNAYVDSNRQILRVSCKVADVGTVRMKEVTELVKAKADSLFPADKFDVICTGITVVFFRGTTYLINNLFLSLACAIVLISLFMAGTFKSTRMVLISLIPNLLPQVLTAALMGFAGVPIKPSTLLVFSIAFGISVDDTIHFLAKYRQELVSNNWDIGKSVITAIKETGISMMYTSIVLFFGFGIFVASDFGGTMALGLLVSFTLMVAMLSNLLLLP
ncbi:MAG: efflux RND transporter permease subunit, partial [Bacteroidota bacterium]